MQAQGPQPRSQRVKHRLHAPILIVHTVHVGARLPLWQERLHS
ncbi:Uncharacterised protein [Mycobacteroides abscessus subsp. abscessus]|nr:Uncharacterised protein [Mycobacteroides abscessus subsp. abscessus]